MSAGASERRVHGGADALGPARWDFSTCANATGPCPQALEAVMAADPTRYPDPAGTAVRQALATLHGVAPHRVLLAASASEFIQRITAVGARLAPGPVQLPRHAYGDYAHAAVAWGRGVVRVDGVGTRAAAAAAAAEAAEAAEVATLVWQAEPSSPFGQDAPPPAEPGARPSVLDAVYAPLRLQGAPTWPREAQDAVFVLHSPNKALGLTGVRAAYAIAPAEAGFDVPAWCAALEAAAPSWPLSAQADAMLRQWAMPDVQRWVAESRPRLAEWKQRLEQALLQRACRVEPSCTPFFVLRPATAWPASAPAALRGRGLAVRDAASFGLPGAWRLSAQCPEAQDALLKALDALPGQEGSAS